MTARRSTHAQRIPHVESIDCPARPGPHRLTNRAGQTVCEACGETWAALDAEIRSAIGWRS